MIKFLDLQKINQKYADELKQEAADVIDSVINNKNHLYFGWLVINKSKYVL